MRFFIYETDLRQVAIGESLVEKGFEKVAIENMGKADVIILPFVNVEKDVVLDSSFFEGIKEGAVVYTGAKDDKVRVKFEKAGVDFREILDSQIMTVLNALPTAEGVLFNLLGDFDKCLVGAKVLVLGYGVCGSVIAEKLKALKSKVYIFEKCELKKADARNQGLKTIKEKEIIEHKFDIIINTIPLKVVSEDTLNRLNINTLVYEVASAPFGFDEDWMIEKGFKYKKLRGLPSRFGVRYSSENISSFILNNLEGDA